MRAIQWRISIEQFSRKAVRMACAIILLLVGTFLCLNAVKARDLTFGERVKAEEAIERVYWDHRIWPDQNTLPKPSFGSIALRAVIEAKVADYLKKSEALRLQWRAPLDAAMLQIEMERMARNSGDPGILKEIFAALGNDPFIIGECLARPLLTERLVRERFAFDREVNNEECCRSGLETNTFERWWDVQQDRYSPDPAPVGDSDAYALVAPPAGCTDDTWRPLSSSASSPSSRAQHTAVWTGAEVIVWGGGFSE